MCRMLEMVQNLLDFCPRLLLDHLQDEALGLQLPGHSPLYLQLLLVRENK